MGVFIKKNKTNKDVQKWLTLSVFTLGLMESRQLGRMWDQESEVRIANWREFSRDCLDSSSVTLCLWR